MRVLFEGSSDRKRKKVSKNVFKKTLKMDKNQPELYSVVD